MSFHDTQRADEVSLRERISLRNDDGVWVTGKVIELALAGDKWQTVAITIRLDDGTVARFSCMPDTPILLAQDENTEDN